MYCIDYSSGVTVSCDTPDALIVINRVELSQLSPFYLDIGSAVQIGGALLMVMAVASVIRMVKNYLLSSESEST